MLSIIDDHIQKLMITDLCLNHISLLNELKDMVVDFMNEVYMNEIVDDAVNHGWIINSSNYILPTTDYECRIVYTGYQYIKICNQYYVPFYIFNKNIRHNRQWHLIKPITYNKKLNEIKYNYQC